MHYLVAPQKPVGPPTYQLIFIETATASQPRIGEEMLEVVISSFLKL